MHSRKVFSIFQIVLSFLLLPKVSAGEVEKRETPGEVSILPGYDLSSNLFVEKALFARGMESGFDEFNNGASSADKKRSDEKVSVLLSFLLPGLGEYSLGDKERAYGFFVLEGATWFSYAMYRIQGSLRKDAYIEFAQRFAGTNPLGKPDEYYRAMGKYQRSDPGPGSYNEEIRRDARFRYPDDRVAQEEYLRQNGYFGVDGWEWESREKMALYATLRTRSVGAYQNARLMVGAMVLNRILSAIDDALILSGKTVSPRKKTSRVSVLLEGEELYLRVALEGHF